VERAKRTMELSTSTIMMLTSGGQRDDAARCRKLGISAYLLKPVRQSELREAIMRVLSAKDRVQILPMFTARNSQAETKPKRSLQILLAEDNLVNQKLALRMLEKRNHIVSVVTNGREALSALEEGSYDVVLMDVQMPEMGGLEATQVLRDQEKLTGRHQAVIAMTALVMKGDRERCLAAGMDGYLSKPIRPEQLDEVLNHLQTVDPNRTQELGPFDPTNSAIAAGELLDRIDGDREFLAELVALFRADCPSQILSARRAVERNDAAELQKVGHALKGALGNLAATTASRMANELESMGKTGNMAAARTKVGQLEEELILVLEALESLSIEAVQ
jgi:two-component system, sensor histidine kinase and response regulator